MQNEILSLFEPIIVHYDELKRHFLALRIVNLMLLETVETVISF